MLRIPKVLKVGGLTYKIQLVDEIDGNRSAGETDTKALTIKLCKLSRPQAIEVTFLHELLHAINIELGEKDVEFLAMALYQVMNDNKGVFTHGE